MNIEDIDRRLCQIEMKVDSMLRDRTRVRAET
jgi:hypothetical protein